MRLCRFALSVACIHMDLKRLGVNKLFMARFTLKLHHLFVCFHMVMHSGLVFLYNSARRANEMAVLIADIDHTVRLGGGGA